MILEFDGSNTVYNTYYTFTDLDVLYMLHYVGAA